MKRVRVPYRTNNRANAVYMTEWAARRDWNAWERERLDAIQQAVTPWRALFDVGSEDGTMSALYAMWGARVVMLEPNDLAWPHARATFEANGLDNALTRPLTYHGYAADFKTTQPVLVDGWPRCAYAEPREAHGFKHLAEAYPGAEGERPRAESDAVTTIDDVVMSTGLKPEVVTIDVEGAELRVLKGMARTLEWAGPKAVFVSEHPDMMKVYGDRQADLHAFMAGLGYTGTSLAAPHEEHWVYQ